MNSKCKQRCFVTLFDPHIIRYKRPTSITGYIELVRPSAIKETLPVSQAIKVTGKREPREMQKTTNVPTSAKMADALALAMERGIRSREQTMTKEEVETQHRPSTTAGK